MEVHISTTSTNIKSGVLTLGAVFFLDKTLDKTCDKYLCSYCIYVYYAIN